MKISVILPIYNSFKSIASAIHSVDTKHDVEIICVNDGSTDQSIQLLHQLAKNDARLKIFSTEHRGISAARNYGLSQMTGDMFMFLRPEDRFFEGQIDKMVEIMEADQDVDIVIGQVGRQEATREWEFIDEHDVIRKNDVVTLSTCKDIMQSMGPGAKLYRAHLASAKFDEDISFTDDHGFTIRTYVKARKIRLYDQMVYGSNIRLCSNITTEQAKLFDIYMKDIMRSRQRIMTLLGERNLCEYYSYRLDDMIVGHIIDVRLKYDPMITLEILDRIIEYIQEMQAFSYSADALYHIIDITENESMDWTKSNYEKWHSALMNVGIKRKSWFNF
ncbi:glycosyltransferase family 2 protein [Staphylococcus massiliensis]|nr:glycosyltransferase family 2 protein [Staphylococcus massiliensis]